MPGVKKVTEGGSWRKDPVSGLFYREAEFAELLKKRAEKLAEKPKVKKSDKGGLKK